jgi:hypothetical protein
MTSIYWMFMRADDFREPFFHQTIRRLRLAQPLACDEVTSLRDLISYAADRPMIQPAAVILHVSRCGSTLLAKVLAGLPHGLPLCEAQPVAALWAQAHRSPSDQTTAGLRSLLSGFSYTTVDSPPKIVIKCHAAMIVQADVVWRAWPGTPVFVLIRHPLEVLASNLRRPAAWLRARALPINGTSIFGWSPANIRSMTLEEFAARTLGKMYTAAMTCRALGAQVIDYDALCDGGILPLAQRCMTQLPVDFSQHIARCLAVNAKDVTGATPFLPDGAAKRAAVSRGLAEAVERWAMPAYSALLRSAPPLGNAAVH